MSWDAVTKLLEQHISEGNAPAGRSIYEAVRAIPGIRANNPSEKAAFFALSFQGLKGRLIWEYRHATQHNFWLGEAWQSGLRGAGLEFEVVPGAVSRGAKSGRPHMVDSRSKGFGDAPALKVVVIGVSEARSLAQVLSRAAAGEDTTPDASGTDTFPPPPTGERSSTGKPEAGSPPDNDGEHRLVAEELARLAKEYDEADVVQRETVVKKFERGTAGNFVKKANGYRCQLCEALSLNPVGFTKKDGRPYVEAHHITPVSLMETGTLSPSNIVTLCANHHRQMHYGNVAVKTRDDVFDVVIDGAQVFLRRNVFN